MITFKKLKFKNFLSTGNSFREIDFSIGGTTLITGINGSGKCLHHSTKIQIDINNNEVKRKFVEFLNERKVKENN